MKNVKTIITFDTAMSGCSVCLVKDGHATSASETMTHGQAERLMPMINDVLSQAKTQTNEIESIIVTMGPGGFTGLRVGLSAAKAMALALDIPLYGISTLQALAAGYEVTKPFTVLVETRREEFYVQSFDEGAHPKSEVSLMTADQIWQGNQKTLFIGDAAERFKTLKPEANIDASATLPTLEKVVQYSLKNPNILIENPKALYLRGADISQAKKKPRKLSA